MYGLFYQAYPYNVKSLVGPSFWEHISLKLKSWKRRFDQFALVLSLATFLIIYSLEMDSSMLKLTEHLILLQTSTPYTAATQHSFLTDARKGTLPIERLSLWLSQDRIYAVHAYPRFIGALISRIPFSESDAVSGPEELKNQHILQVLVGCLDNIVKEVGFFQDTATEFGLDIGGRGLRKGTRDYTAEMARISLSGSLNDGLIFLWAMEQVSSI